MWTWTWSVVSSKSSYMFITGVDLLWFQVLSSRQLVLILRFGLSLSMERRSDCRFGILPDKKDLGPSRQRMIEFVKGWNSGIAWVIGTWGRLQVFCPQKSWDAWCPVQLRQKSAYKTKQMYLFKVCSHNFTKNFSRFPSNKLCNCIIKINSICKFSLSRQNCQVI